MTVSPVPPIVKPTPPRQDVSRAALSLARATDRLQDGKYIAHIEKRGGRLVVEFVEMKPVRKSEFGEL